MGFLIEVPTSFSSIEKKGKWLIPRDTPTKKYRAGAPDFFVIEDAFLNWKEQCLLNSHKLPLNLNFLG